MSESNSNQPEDDDGLIYAPIIGDLIFHHSPFEFYVHLVVEVSEVSERESSSFSIMELGEFYYETTSYWRFSVSNYDNTDGIRKIEVYRDGSVIHTWSTNFE